MEKICKECETEKDISEFSKKYKTKDGVQKYQPKCKECVNKKAVEYRDKLDKEKVKEYNGKYREENHEQLLKQKRQYHIKNREAILMKKQEYRAIPENRERAKEYQSNYQKENREKYYEYRNRNPHIIAWRNLLNRTLRYTGIDKKGSTEDMIGYTSTEIREHIESQFIDGMSWDNHGEWEIDHIKPLTKFDTNTEPSVVNALSNLQPLWKIDNIRKYNHY